MMQKATTFQSVRLGDYIYQSGYYASDKWREVTKISMSGDTVSLSVGHTAHDTIDTRTQICGHKAQGIAVKRA